MKPPEQTVEGKTIEFTSVASSVYWYPRATMRCRCCGYWYAPYAELWSKKPNVCAICATPVYIHRPATDGAK